MKFYVRTHDSLVLFLQCQKYLQRQHVEHQEHAVVAKHEGDITIGKELELNSEADRARQDGDTQEATLVTSINTVRSKSIRTSDHWILVSHRNRFADCPPAIRYLLSLLIAKHVADRLAGWLRTVRVFGSWNSILNLTQSQLTMPSSETQVSRSDPGRIVSNVH